MGLPKRWLPYSNFGQPIPGTRFIALKCPLKPALCEQIPPDKQFTPTLVLERLPSLKMIIDLTFTSKYYTPEVFQGAGLRHVKVLCEGHNVPNNKVVQTFFQTVDGFLEAENEGLIGVHCTHGVNRTGFLICKYMISKLGFEPEEAIKVFGEARGHCIERTNYLCSLGLNSGQAEKMAGSEPKDPGAGRSNRDERRNARGRGWSQPPKYQHPGDERGAQDWQSGPAQHHWRNNFNRYDSRPRKDYNSDRYSNYAPRGRGNWSNSRGNYQERGNSRWEERRRPQDNLSWRRPAESDRFRDGDSRARPESNERRGGDSRVRPEQNERFDRRGGDSRVRPEQNERFDRRDGDTRARPESHEVHEWRGGDSRFTRGREYARRPRDDFPEQDMAGQTDKRFCEPFQPRDVYPGNRGHVVRLDMGHVVQPDMGHVLRPDMGNASRPDMDRGHRIRPEIDTRHVSAPDMGHVSRSNMDKGEVSRLNMEHLSRPDVRHVSRPDIGHVSRPDMGHVSRPEVGHIMSRPDMGHIMSRPDIGHVSRPDMGHVSRPEVGHIMSRPDIEHVSRPDMGHVSRPEVGHIMSRPDIEHVSRPDMGHVSRPEVGHIMSRPDIKHVSRPDMNRGQVSGPDMGHIMSRPDIRHVSRPDMDRGQVSGPYPPNVEM